MKTNTRRKFIRNSSLTATGLFLTSITKAKNESVVLTAIGCAPNQLLSLTGTVISTKSGNWSDPATWGGRIPMDADLPSISTGHSVIYDLPTGTISGLNINAGALLKFDSLKSTTLRSSKNIVVNGTLEMAPTNATVNHFIQFINIDQTKFIGGGHMVLDTDIGLWVMGNGKLNLNGSLRKSWTNLSGSASKGATSITLKENPLGWAANDEIVICPTQSIDGLGRPNTVPLFERVKIKTISGNNITIDVPLQFDHLKVEPVGSGKSWTAEVLNLTRNVRIEGTETGKSHVFVKSTVPQAIKNVGFRYLGPKTANIGRYAIHFHHCFNGSVGSIVENCVAFDQGSHSFVPHTSHGVTFKNCVAFNFLQDAFWWDEGHVTHSAIYDSCVAALGAGVGFLLGMGDDNICSNCVAVSAAIGREGGSPNNSGAYLWEANNEGVWEFKDNLSHSNYNGLRVWQNTHKNHVLENYCSYNNMLANFHGAYMNSYTYKNGYHYNSLALGKATSSQTSGVRYENVTFDAAGALDYAAIYSDSPIESWGENTNKYYNCTFKGFKIAPILFESAKPTINGVTEEVVKIKKYDFIHCDLGGKLPVVHADVENGTVIRIQPKTGQCIKIEKVGLPDLSNGKIVTSNIAAFTAKIWGSGDGLMGEYFNGTNQFEASKKVVNRIDSIIAFNEWSTLSGDDPEMFHHKLTGDLYTVRWSGKLLAQYSEDYIFKCNTAGGIKLTVNGVVVIDEWDAEPFNINDRFALTSIPIKLVAGEFHDIKLEHVNRGGYRGCLLHWKSTSMSHFEIVPQCQLYPSNAVVTPPVVEEPKNAIPVAKAGEDKTITLPVNQVILDGSASSDTDGKIISYKWTKVSGPTQFSITKPLEAITTITNLVEGEYVFRLEVKDDKGALVIDEVKVTVNPAVEEEKSGLTAKAGADITIKLPQTTATLDGSNSVNTSGNIISYKWSKVSGPSQFTISNSGIAKTSVNNLVVGTYTFSLEITDENDNTAKDEMKITVNEQTANKGPIAIAGDNIELTLPSDSAKLNAFASTDPDGIITSYKWNKVSGPSKFIIASPTAASTIVSNLTEGEYLFRLEVKDDKGAIATDEVKLKVNPKQVEVVPPKANAGADQTITLPGNNVKLRGEGTNGSTGVISTYAWTKVSGPSKFKIVNPNSASTVVNQLVQGTYVFQLVVKDSNNAVAKDEVTITIVGKSDTQQPAVSGNNVADQLMISASPNPSPNVFNIQFNSNSDKPINLKLYDKWGIEVGNIKNVKKGSTVKIPGNLKRGTYFATAEQGFQKKTITLIKL